MDLPSSLAINVVRVYSSQLNRSKLQNKYCTLLIDIALVGRSRSISRR